MRAVGYFAPGPITAPNSLMDIELPRPSATGRDLLVEVRAVSVNPVDYKVRASAAPPAGTAKVIGYDAAGVVVEAGPQASLFRPGDEVFYAGSIIRSGTNAEFHLVDERIVGHKPRSLGFAEAAARRSGFSISRRRSAPTKTSNRRLPHGVKPRFLEVVIALRYF